MQLNLKFKTVLINLITTLILAIGLELGLGYGLRHPRVIPDFLVRYYKNFYTSEDRSILQVTHCAEYDPEFFYKFKNGKCSFRNREFDVMNYINSAGLRDDEESLENPSIVIFGDSFTMGWGVPQLKAYPQILESLCHEKVLNAGISSFGTAREMKLLKKLDFKCLKTVIIQYHSNDFEENLASIENNFKLPISNQKTYDSLKKNISDRSRYFPFKYLKGISKSIVLSTISPKENVVNDTIEARAFLDILLNSNLDKVTTRVLVFKIAPFVNDNANDNKFVDAVDYLLKDDQYAKLNISTVRINEILNKDDYFILDPHINESGHEKLAARLNEYLKGSGVPVIAVNPIPVRPL